MHSDQTDGTFVSPVRTYGGGTTLTLQADGELTMDVSSGRFKENVREAEDLTAVFDRVNVRRYTVKATGKEDVGFVAEELAEHVPEMVPHDAEDKPLGVRYDKLAVILWQEAQRVRAEIAETSVKIAALRSVTVAV